MTAADYEIRHYCDKIMESASKTMRITLFDVLDLGVAALAIWFLIVWAKQRGETDQARTALDHEREKTEAELVRVMRELLACTRGDLNGNRRVINQLDHIERHINNMRRDVRDKTMDMQELLPTLSTVLVIAWMIIRFFTKRYESDQITQFVKEHGPDGLKDIQLWAAEKAWEALEQLGDAYDISEAERQKKARKLAKRLLDLALKGQISYDAASGLVESVIYNKKRDGERMA